MTQDISPPPPPPPPPQPQSSLSFSQGFLLGQFSIVLLLGAFIKFFIFGDPPSPPSRSSTTITTTTNRSHNRSPRPSTPQSHKPTTNRPHSHPTPTSPAHLHRPRSTVLRPPHPPALTTSTLLSKTAYDVATHAPESLDWFNVLIAQTLSQIRAEAHADDAVLTSLAAVLNGGAKPAFLDEVRVTDLCLGEEFPRFRNCRVGFIGEEEVGATGGMRGKGKGIREGGDGARLQARMDVDLSDDCITLALETKVLLNYPKPRTAVLPVALAVSVVRFSGTLCVSFLPSSSSSSSSSNNTSAHHPSSSSSSSPTADSSLPTGASGTSPTTLSFTFLPDYELELSTRSLVGSRSRLQDVPKIAQIVESRLRAWFDERCVVPTVQMVVLPSLWPRKRSIGTRVASGGGAGGGGVAVGGGGDGDGGGEEVEVETKGEGDRGGSGKREGNGEEEGLRWRGDRSR